MPTELYSTLFDELGRNVANADVEDADDKLDSLPDEAFENRKILSDPINCLEL